MSPGGEGRDAPLTILMVEDNPGDAELLRLSLEEGAGSNDASGAANAVVLHAERVSEARTLLASHPVDVVLLDLSLPDARGLDTVARVRDAAPHLPIVVLTGLDDEALAVRAVQAGAQDYLVKGAVTGRGMWRAVRHARERQRLVEAARRATHARDVVLGVVAHDLRNPLGAVKMCAAALASQESPDASQVGELAGVIRSSVDLMERIIRDLLDVSAIEAGRLAVDPEPTSVAAVLALAHELAEPLAAERGVTLALRSSAGGVSVNGDGARLQQALGNLLGNAVKFTPRGGRVTLGAARTDDGRAVRFEVADTGPGIPPEHLPHVFDRFWQARETRRGGAGLGLAIVKGIAEAHGGAAGVESASGAGARFWLTVPVSD
ncbi:ATP-binding region ATPase domain protein [Gemmatirosa kalamazoonensis]|uniref:histidine kinase n=1 Tax=Gemmatirosa kalamazoonensis TaxID=861299 RepID=W0REC1_9BACT|nr:hybrid sensor histidine kinase/response regulator [Gemmatirosa kalamazoonensis]AHG89454.1 ATP-binding region ATPase domain protein [Gemmatirosa kalamazoonensis]